MAERLRMLVTVKAYPAVSRKYGESVCVAGVTEPGPDQRWVRLFPVQFRELEWSQRFKKYQLIELEVNDPGSDKRPESKKPNLESLTVGEVVRASNGWRDRRPFIEPLMQPSMCEVLRRQSQDGTSLAVFRPYEVLDFDWEEGSEEWTGGQETVVDQPSMLFPSKSRLERIPYTFRYRYRCDEASCGTHYQSIIDWELAEAFRSWRADYSAAVLLEKLKQKWLEVICDPSRDTAFFVGNQHLHPRSFLVLGAYWPPQAT